MRYPYHYTLFVIGYNCLASASWSAYAIRVTSLSAVRDSSFCLLREYPGCSVYVVRTLRSSENPARFYCFDEDHGRLVEIDSLVAIMSISAGPQFMPR